MSTLNPFHNRRRAGDGEGEGGAGESEPYSPLSCLAATIYSSIFITALTEEPAGERCVNVETVEC